MTKCVISIVILIACSGRVFGQQCEVDCMCPEPDANRHSVQITEKLQAGQHAVLCPGTTWLLHDAVHFGTVPNTYLLTYGYPRDDSRALLKIDSATLGVAILNDLGCDYCQIRNIRVDGGRDTFGFLGTPASCVIMGGASTGQIIDSVTISNPRNAACLGIENGPPPSCSGIQVTNNWFGPAGFYDGTTWADGIQLQCRNSIVFYNEITDTTDAGIAVFGSAGSDIHDNRITALTRDQIYGISMVDPADYTNTLVHDNIINGQSAKIHNGIAMGPHTTTACDLVNYNNGASVYNNSLQGGMGYGLAVDGVTGWSIYNNGFYAFHYGTPLNDCQTGQPLPAAQKCAINLAHSATSYQPECVNVPSLHGAALIQ
jgi:hypothetical protein